MDSAVREGSVEFALYSESVDGLGCNEHWVF